MVRSNNRVLEETAGSAIVSGQELLSVVAIGTLFLLVTIRTSMLYPVVWMDEVMLIDPAVNLYFGNGWTSTTTSLQARDEFWAGNPLYPFVVWAWITVFGFGPVVVRALNSVLVLASVGIIWVSVVRLQLVCSASSRIALVSLLLMGYGMSFCYRSGRSDVLLILLISLSLLVFALSSGRTRYVMLTSLSALYPLAGLQSAPYAVTMSLILLLYLGRTFLREFVSILLGVILGLVALACFLWINGVLDIFLSKVSSHTSTGLVGSVLDGTFSHRNRVPKEPSLMMLLLALTLISIQQYKHCVLRRRSVVSFAIAVSVVIPTALLILSKFPTYYAWMVFVPVAICVTAVLPNGSSSSSQQFSVWLCLLVALLMGTPIQLLVSAYDHVDRDYTKVERLVESNVTKKDWVYCAFAAYYPAKKSAETVFHPPYELSPKEKEKISVVIARPSHAIDLIETLGGKWRSAATLAPQKEPLWNHLFGSMRGPGLFDRNYDLVVWKRVPNATDS